MKEKIEELITRSYIESRDYNGISYILLLKQIQGDEEELKVSLGELVQDDRIEILYGDHHPNPFIKAYADTSKSEQLLKLGDPGKVARSCIYPTKAKLKEIEGLDARFAGRPYEKELALGEGQLAFHAFDLSTLEIYRDDPRYYYVSDDIDGMISVTDKYDQSNEMQEADKVLLQTFGFCYNDDLDRAVAVFLRYLADLSPEHQQLWKSKELSGDYKIHPDYYRSSILGEWHGKISLFDAFIMELEIINSMCERIGKPHLFRKTYRNDKPRVFAFLLRPTLQEFNDFFLISDIMMSDNLNKDFFRGDIELENEEERGDGKIVVHQKGTIQLLENWLNRYFRTDSSEAVIELCSAFRKVRQIRQRPAHSIKPNEFNQKYFHEQRELMLKAYNAIRTIRLILANHLRVKSNPPQINEYLFNGEIWDR